MCICKPIYLAIFFFFNDTATTEIYTLSLHDALPIYAYDQGGWNEWHVMMNDGTSAWLSDAQSEYALSWSSKAQNLPAVAQVHVGQQFTWSDQRYTVSVITPAHYRGVEGELPFQYWDKTD